jgi:hypothetical protein
LSAAAHRRLFPIRSLSTRIGKRFSVLRHRLHKNHRAKIVVFYRGGKKNEAYAYKTIGFLDGEYRHGPVKGKEKDLIDLGLLKKAQQKELQRLSGKDYDLFVNSFQLTSEEEDLDGMGIKGTSGFVRGLPTEMNAIVLYRPDGKIWAAVIDSEDDTVKYFTNDPAYAGKLLKTIDKWRERFADKKVLFMSKTK